MSERELERLKILEDITEKRLSVVQGALLAGLSRRQMTRLVKGFRDNGIHALVSIKKLASQVDRKFSDHNVVELVRQHYPDFGPTLATKDQSHHNILFSRNASNWKIRCRSFSERRGKVYQPRTVETGSWRTILLMAFIVCLNDWPKVCPNI